MEETGADLEKNKTDVYKNAKVFFLLCERMIKMETKDLMKLLDFFGGGDMGAFPLIYSEFEKLIRFYALKLQREDAVQEFTVFLLELLWKLTVESYGFRNSEEIKRYIAVSIRNKYIALSKAEQRQRVEMNFFENMAYTTASLADDFGDLAVNDALSGLTPKQREMIILKYIFNYTDCEIAQRLNITRQAVNRLKNRAIHTLKQYYFEEGLK